MTDKEAKLREALSEYLPTVNIGDITHVENQPIGEGIVSFKGAIQK